MKQWKRDVLYGIGLICASAVLLWQTVGLPTGGMKYILARSDMYIWMLLILMTLLSLGIIIKALKEKDETPTPPIWNKLGIITIVVTTIYLLVMKTIGFIASTFLAVTILTCVYSHRLGKFNCTTKKEKIFQLGKYCIFGLIVTIVTYYVFAEGLDVKLPVFSLF